jgi:hypothetical protein
MSKKISSRIIRTIVSILLIFVAFYVQLPPINLRSKDFWAFLIEILVIIMLVNLVTLIKHGIFSTFHLDPDDSISSVFRELKQISKPMLYTVMVIIAIVLLLILGDIIGHPFFHAKAYYNLLPITESNFTEDVSQISMGSIPVVDKDSASRLGKRKLGEMSDLVSQFEIMEDYTQINYNNTPYRVTPLSYGDMVKWFYNQSDGIPAYLTVNMVTQASTLVRLDEGIKYSESEYFFRDINRHLRFHYPTKIFDQISFEIDEDGTPYWIAPTIAYRIGLWSGQDIDGAVLVNAQTGECNYYSLEEIPSWVDQVFTSDLISQQLEYYGKYGSGFINSMFGQKGVLEPTDGYNYLAIDDDVYLYTGLTSVMSDASNVGFVLVNLRTKEAHYYNVPGAEEYSAMSSAEGKVQNLGYDATFPILLNIAERPTYFLSLKDDAGLVKMYAFVDVEQYQIVGTGSTVGEAMQNYSQALSSENLTTDNGDDTSEEETNTTLDAQGVISALSSAVVSGNTCYYFTLEGEDAIYQASIETSEQLPFLKAGDSVKFSYITSGNVREVQVFYFDN